MARSLVVIALVLASCARRGPIRPGGQKAVAPPVKISARMVSAGLLWEGSTFQVTLANTSQTVVLLDTRCLWAIVHVDDVDGAGACVPPTPAVAVRNQFVVRLEPGEVFPVAVAPSTFLTAQTFDSAAAGTGGREPATTATVFFLYDGGRIRPGGTRAPGSQAPTGLWLGTARSAGLSMPLTELEAHFETEMTAEGWKSTAPRKVNAKDANFTVWVNSESHAADPVDVVVEIDGHVVFEGTIGHTPHGVKEVPLFLAGNVHIVRARAWDGRVIAETTVDVNVPQWCWITFWHTPKGTYESDPAHSQPANLQIKCAERPFGVL